MANEVFRQLELGAEGFQPDRVFANENARIGWEVSQVVDRIAASLPPETARLNAEPITFDSEHELRGLHAIFTAGTVIFTSDLAGAILVPERSRQILDILGIPYRTGFPEE